MRWYRELYTGDSIRRRHKKIKWKIMHNAGQIRVYAITLASGTQNLLDIIPSWELLQKHYPKQQLYVIGLAGSYDEALEVAGRIVSEVYKETGGFDIRRYIHEKEQQDA